MFGHKTCFIKCFYCLEYGRAGMPRMGNASQRERLACLEYLFLALDVFYIFTFIPSLMGVVGVFWK